MRIGLCGSHRTGKTTLANAIASHAKIPFVKTNIGKIFEENGFDPSKPMKFSDRLKIQYKIIAAAIESWESESGDFITDRTPIDMIAYTLADIQGDSEVDILAPLYSFDNYMERCFAAANRLFTHFIVIQPAIIPVYEAYKAALNRAYMEHINTLIIGLCHDERLLIPSTVIKREIISIEERVRVVIGHVAQSLRKRLALSS